MKFYLAYFKLKCQGMNFFLWEKKGLKTMSDLDVNLKGIAYSELDCPFLETQIVFFP